MRDQLVQRFVEIGLRRRRHTIGILAEKYFVQVQFKNTLFVQRVFQPGRQNDLFDLTFGAPVA